MQHERLLQWAHRQGFTPLTDNWTESFLCPTCSSPLYAWIMRGPASAAMGPALNLFHEVLATCMGSQRENEPLGSTSGRGSATASSPHTTRSSSGPSASQGQSLPTRRKELVILTTAGWALFTVFLLTVIGGLLPLQPRDLAWSQNISRLTVDAGSLALVGLCLVRYGSYLRSRDLPARQSRARASGSGKSGSDQKNKRPLPLDQSDWDRLAVERNKLWVRRMAIAGAVGMALLAPLQVVIFMRGAAALDLEITQAALQQRQQFQRLEAALRDAPAERLRQGWIQLKKLDPANLPTTLPAPASQLDDLIAEANRNRDTSQQNLRSRASSARFALGRDTLRVLLASLVYGWAFWAFFRRA